MFNRNSKNIISKSLVILIIIMIVSSYMPSGIGLILNKAEAIEDTVQSNIDETLSYIENNLNPLDNWELICAVKGAGADIHNSSVWILPEWNTGTITEGSSAGTYGSRIIGLIAMDKNPESIWGRNLINELILKQNEITGSFGTLLDQVYAMHALELADADYNEYLALDCLLEQQSSDGGFGFSGVSDLDVTGMVLRLLANYTENSEVVSSISNSIAYIKASQLDSGGFESYGTKNSNTIAVLISGLTSVGEDVQSADWEKGGNNLADALNMFRLSDGSYKWKLDDLQPNNLATIQSLEALGDMLAGNSILNRLDYYAGRISVDLRIEGISETKFNEQVLYAGYPNPTVEDVLTYALDGAGISYEIEDSSYGPYLKSIDGETAGKFEGYDGWLYLLNGSDGYGIGTDTVKDGDEVVVYYGDFAPGTLIPEVVVSPEIIYVKDNITFTVSSTYFDWDTYTTTTTAIEGAKIEIGGKSYITDADGQVKLSGGTLSAGEYKYKVSKNVEGSVPAILRTDELSLTIKASSSTGPVSTESFKVNTAVIGKDGEVIFGPRMVSVSSSDKYGATALAALDASGLNCRIIDSGNGLFVEEIDGQENEGMSGWMYAVNGKAPNISASIKDVSKGDEILWWYSTSAAAKVPEWPGSSTGQAVTKPEQNEAIDKTPIDNKKRISFDDVDDSITWARDAIEILAGNGIIDGTGSGFEPQRPITRAEFIKIIVKALNLEIKDASGNVYNDVDKSEWFVDFVECASENNIITGYPDGKFRPNDVISRNEIAVILSRIINNPETLGSYDLEFQDAKGIPEWAKDGVKYAVMTNLMKGYEDNTFKGEQPLTRAEAAVVIYRYLTELI